MKQGDWHDQDDNKKAGSEIHSNGLWWEPDVHQTKKLNTALEKTLISFGLINDCEVRNCHPGIYS
ncbi:MAG: hypothetical protein K6G81_05745 [Lachnospiraceae bacterium]|nr:hypothetical protein [Lachnospiraceae bacterium]